MPASSCRRSGPRPPRPKTFAGELARTVASFRSSHPEIVCEGVGVSVPGRVDVSGRIVFAPNLRWEGTELRQLLERAIGLPVAIENAASACALAELWFGRQADDVRHLVAVTVSEGIGVGLLVNGQLVHGRGAMAGEFGHVTLDENGPPCSCGKSGCWERYASNSAAVRFYQELSGDGPIAGQPAVPRAALGIDDILRLADEGDSRAVKTLEHVAHYLGIGLANIVTGLAPQVVIIVGEVTAAWDRHRSDRPRRREAANAPDEHDPNRAHRPGDAAAAPGGRHAGRAGALRRAERRVGRGATG